MPDPDVTWTGGDTYIQRTGIARDLGLFGDPDAFYAEHRQRFGLAKGLIYRNVLRHCINRRVAGIRAGRVPRIPSGSGTFEPATAAAPADAGDRTVAGQGRI